jgi:tetratricopeptide (TPR) repeat protein
MEYQYGVAAAFELSWEQLEADIQRKGCYLSLYGLAPIVFDVETIEDIEAQENWIIALNTLVDWHLLEQLENTDNQYLFHPLVREFFRDKFAQFPPEEQQEYKDSFLAAIIAIAETIEEQPTRNQIEIVSPWIPHLEEVAHHWIRDLSDDDLITPSNRLGQFYQGQGLYQQAEPWYQQSQELAQQRFGEEHPDYATALNNLALLYHFQGRYSEAEPLYHRALAIKETSLPPTIPV